MPSLTDPTPISTYSNVLVTMYEQWTSQIESQRRQAFEQQVHSLCSVIGMPPPKVSWGSTGGSFDYSTWSLECDVRSYRSNPHVVTATNPKPLKGWLYFSTSIYHEMRHGEQFWLIAKAILANKIPMPQMMSKAVVPGGDSFSKLASHLSFPIAVARQAHMARHTFNDQDIARTRAWCESVFGRYGKIRKQTYHHLNKGGKHMNEYVNLAEEADAWAVERQVSRAVRDRIGTKASADAFAGLANLFA